MTGNLTGRQFPVTDNFLSDFLFLFLNLLNEIQMIPSCIICARILQSLHIFGPNVCKFFFSFLRKFLTLKHIKSFLESIGLSDLLTLLSFNVTKYLKFLFFVSSLANHFMYSFVIFKMVPNRFDLRSYYY
jgi:hypothetical protein